MEDLGRSEMTDTALEGYVYWLIESGSLASKDLLQDTANRLQARRDPPCPPVSKNW